jgi:hypothetical protein
MSEGHRIRHRSVHPSLLLANIMVAVMVEGFTQARFRGAKGLQHHLTAAFESRVVKLQPFVLSRNRRPRYDSSLALSVDIRNLVARF